MILTDNVERKPHPGEMELCLCSSCASTYYNMPDRRIKRVDMLQMDKDICTLCGYRRGYDFYVWPVSNVQKKRNVQIHTFVKGARNE